MEVGAASSSSSSSSKTRKTTTKSKDRHIVSWTAEEDDVLREQVGVHGTDNWTSIASKFKDKTSRQCRRRWYTYLNTECKKGGWSREEDMLLCEAQKLYGNRWTEIAKVVSGRTDNAVKNRFNTLSKKRAKQNTHGDENDNSILNPGNNGISLQEPSSKVVTSESALKRIRCCISNAKEIYNGLESLHPQLGTHKEISRTPLKEITQNDKISPKLPPQHRHTKDYQLNDQKTGFRMSFLNRDDPKFMALMGQAELLSSLAQKISKDNSERNLEAAWKELRDYLVQSGEHHVVDNELADIDFLLDNIKDSIKDLCNQPEYVSNFRSPNLHDNIEGEFEHTTGNPTPSNSRDTGLEYYIKECFEKSVNNVNHVLESENCGPLSPLEDVKGTNNSAPPNSEHSSPLCTVPPFPSFDEVIPSPKFSESERRFLLGLLGISSPSSKTSSDTSNEPSCKRQLLPRL